MHKTWLLAGVASLGLLGAASPSARADRDYGESRGQGDGNPYRHEDYSKTIKFQDLPGEAQYKVERLKRGNEQIVEADELMRHDQVSYRVWLRERDGDLRSIRINPVGEVIAVKEWGRQGPQGPLYLSNQDIDEQGNWSDWYLAPTGTRRQLMGFESLPGPVKQTVAQNRGMDTISRVIKVTHDGQTFYRVRIDAPTTSRILFVGADGRLLLQQNATEPGRERVPFDTLPGRTKSTITQQAGGQQIDHVTQITRHGQTFYVATVIQRDGEVKLIWVDNNGNVLQQKEYDRMK